LTSVEKIAVPNETGPDLNQIFNSGLKNSSFKELFIISGHGAVTPDFQVKHAENPAAQTRDIFLDMQKYMSDNGYSFNDLIQIQMTITKDVNDEQFEEVIEIYKEFMKGIAVLPTGGTMRVVERLAFPGMMVEFEFMAAK
jgi:enamine deaminase RidA (YjgF/YER057c/UK114 family)